MLAQNGPKSEVDPILKIIDPKKSIAEDCCSIASSVETVHFGNIYENLALIYNFSLKTAWNKLSDKVK